MKDLIETAKEINEGIGDKLDISKTSKSHEVIHELMQYVGNENPNQDQLMKVLTATLNKLDTRGKFTNKV